ncbi:helix-turn-helix domain-containing protein [Embleya hyalina]|uniref:helix-turn-helix domain-containing protein n=1 Tax=Embleya hyalina TaxID=516124 RepID=UPI000F8323A6|nr:helix-turn-helix domain-containing protein [Embleya hyalina]
MSRWQELPDSLDRRVRQLVVQLRRLKDRSGLSLVSLAARTGYSRSSWERCLNGRALPPRHVVEGLARIVGADPVRLLVLHEVAEEAWRQSTAPTAPAVRDEGAPGARGGAAAEGPGPAEDFGTAEHSDAVEGSAPAQDRAPAKERAGASEEPAASEDSPGTARPPGVRRPVVLAAVVIAALVGVGVGMLIGGPRGDDDGRRRVTTGVGTPGPRPTDGPPTTAGGPGRYRFQPGKAYPCEVRRADAVGGGLSAGYSASRTVELAGPGWDVVEAQCLLDHHRMDPGIVDGVYGQQTIAAVIRMQKEAGLPADGIVGPHTWQVLRG